MTERDRAEIVWLVREVMEAAVEAVVYYVKRRQVSHAAIACWAAEGGVEKAQEIAGPLVDRVRRQMGIERWQSAYSIVETLRTLMDGAKRKPVYVDMLRGYVAAVEHRLPDLPPEVGVAEVIAEARAHLARGCARQV
jgi:hypothetical protein